MIAFESLLERDFIYLLDYDPAVEWFEEQPLSIEYLHEGKQLHYTPDFHLLEDGQHVLVKCKPERFVETEENRRRNGARRGWVSGHTFAQEKGFSHHLVFEWVEAGLLQPVQIFGHTRYFLRRDLERLAA